MKIYLYGWVAVLTLWVGSAQAQMTVESPQREAVQTSPRAFKQELAQPVLGNGARIVVDESRELEPMLNRTHSLEEKVRGYRIRIFFDNSQQARNNAQVLMERFETSFPDIPAYLVYENPYFKVTVGNCLTMDEAMIVLGRVKGQFDRAFPVQEDLPLKYFATTVAETPSETTELPAEIPQ